jgi:hypothetical protein
MSLGGSGRAGGRAERPPVAALRAYSRRAGRRKPRPRGWRAIDESSSCCGGARERGLYRAPSVLAEDDRDRVIGLPRGLEACTPLCMPLGDPLVVEQPADTVERVGGHQHVRV